LPQDGKRPVDHIARIATVTQEVELKHCTLDFAGPTYSGRIGLLPNSIIDRSRAQLKRFVQYQLCQSHRCPEILRVFGQS
jgi:hypothetical protein